MDSYFSAKIRQWSWTHRKLLKFSRVSFFFGQPCITFICPHNLLQIEGKSSCAFWLIIEHDIPRNGWFRSVKYILPLASLRCFCQFIRTIHQASIPASLCLSQPLSETILYFFSENLQLLKTLKFQNCFELKKIGVNA